MHTCKDRSRILRRRETHARDRLSFLVVHSSSVVWEYVQRGVRGPPSVVSKLLLVGLLRLSSESIFSVLHGSHQWKTSRCTDREASVLTVRNLCLGGNKRTSLLSIAQFRVFRHPVPFCGKLLVPATPVVWFLLSVSGAMSSPKGRAEERLGNDVIWAACAAGQRQNAKQKPGAVKKKKLSCFFRDTAVYTSPASRRTRV